MNSNNKYKLPENFINRELSWLEFNNRVLEEAVNKNNPLMEQLKFASIVSSNLDEFFMIRVASIFDQVSAGFDKFDASGLNPVQQLDKISGRTHKMIDDLYTCYNRSFIPRLKKHGISFLKYKELNQIQKKFIQNYYDKTVYPVLTPMVVDQSRPFPLVLNKSLNIALALENADKNDPPVFATVQVPSVLGRFVEIPSDSGTRCFVFLEDIIKWNLGSLFNGHEIITMGCYRITRNADQDLDEEDAEDLLEAIEQFVKKRKWGAVIRLEVEKGLDPKLLSILTDEMEVEANNIYEVNGPIDLTFLMKLSNLRGCDELRFSAFNPVIPEEFKSGNNIFDTLSKGDIMLHHPYQSFDPVIELVRQSASDPKVLAIKQTLYRVSGHSPLVEALAQAAENGKQVTVLVELKARFDEENNILWARRLERSGCHVIYGLLGLKTHCKLLLIVRMEEGGIKRYVHMSTGNYNDVTAKIYEDIGLFTSNPYFGADASSVFNMLSGYSRLPQLYKFDVAPLTLRNRFLDLISQEAANARIGKKAKIIAKMNSLVDERIIEALYDASCAGVSVDLIIRGICCLKPGIPGLSENIHVRSIVGRFLEHSRIFYFYNDARENIYLASADWMSRNMDRRVELLFPVEDKDIRSKIMDILDVYLSDNSRARELKNDGTYIKVKRAGKESCDSQTYFMNSEEK